MPALTLTLTLDPNPNPNPNPNPDPNPKQGLEERIDELGSVHAEGGKAHAPEDRPSLDCLTRLSPIHDISPISPYISLYLPVPH